jgi:uncharacterized membrane protein YdbT with pleckstrin-like domain
MGFPRRLLGENEEILFEKRPHWVALVIPIFWAVVILAAAIFALTKVDDPGWLRWVIIGAAVIGLLILSIGPFLKRFFTLFVLTTDRIITRSGVIAKNSKEIPLESINDITFNQSILERMVGAGDLLIESAGERGQNRITNVRDPEGTQLEVYKASEENSNRMHRGGLGPQQFAPQAEDKSIPAQLEALARLKDQGVISDVEFETKKEELLKRL